MLARALIAASAAIILVLGGIHLWFTFFSGKFSPRDAELEARMKAVSPVISGQTTMWRAWIGFNASHSMGAILFGAIYGYLAVFHGPLLMQPGFFALVGALFLSGYLLLGKRYWFSVPFRGIALALVLYMLGFTVALMQGSGS